MRLSPSLPGLSRRVLAVVLLVSHALAATGAPLPAKAATGKGGPARPCQGRACGCSTTEQSWGDCCCLTQKEKLAWAAARGVSVPAQPKPKKSCCSADKDGEPLAKPASSCCEQEHRDSAPPVVRWVSGVQAQKCRGEGPAGLLKLELVAEPDPLPTLLATRVPVDLLPGFDCRVTSTPHFPPTPPPRVS